LVGATELALDVELVAAELVLISCRCQVVVAKLLLPGWYCWAVIVYLTRQGNISDLVSPGQCSWIDIVS
jgi:hypothetical protein